MKTRVSIALCALCSVHCGARSSIDDSLAAADGGGGAGGSGGGPVVPPTRSRIFVLEAETFQGKSRVDAFDDMTGAGFAAWEGDGTFFDSCTPALDSQGRLLFTDGGYRVVRMNLATGHFDVLESAPIGDRNFTAGALALDTRGRIYVTDPLHHRIFRVDDLSGAGWVSFGEAGTAEGQFGEPDGVAVDSDGKIVVADAVNHRIIQVDDMTGAGWTAWSMPPAAGEPFATPAGVAIDAHHRIYAVDFEGSVLHRIDRIDGSGHEQYAPPPQPSQVYVAKDGRIYLSLFNGVNAIASIDDMSGAGYTQLGGPPGHAFINPCGVVVE